MSDRIDSAGRVREMTRETERNMTEISIRDSNRSVIDADLFASAVY
jgi:hypothetical protein